MSISRDGHTAIIQAGAAADSNTMVRAADDLKTSLHKLQGDGVQVSLTGASGMWSDFNTANRDAMMKSELISLAGDADHPACSPSARSSRPACR